jgi:hypothetical protein
VKEHTGAFGTGAPHELFSLSIEFIGFEKSTGLGAQSDRGDAYIFAQLLIDWCAGLAFFTAGHVCVEVFRSGGVRGATADLRRAGHNVQDRGVRIRADHGKSEHFGVGPRRAKRDVAIDILKPHDVSKSASELAEKRFSSFPYSSVAIGSSGGAQQIVRLTSGNQTFGAE